MAKSEEKHRLSEGEMNMMRMLWEKGQVSLSEAHQAMGNRGETVGYTTVQTRLERLVKKGVVTKSAGRPAKYGSAIQPEQVSAPMLDLLLERVSGPVPMLAHLLQDPSLTRNDFEKIKKLIAEAEQRLQEE
jgi:BlaI family transcriptional regulator, penicillinase repressor